jgi:hypothetical protein
MKRSRLRQNDRSGEMLLLWEQQYGNISQLINTTNNAEALKEEIGNATEKMERIRASVRIDMNDIDNFVKFHVSTNDVPVSSDKTGKDIIVDWHMLEGFDTDEKFWVDANGMQMVYKTLNKRAEYNFKDAETESPYSVAANYYPMTSAIAVKDHGSSSNQVLVMNQNSHGASAGLRDRANIEIMHQRRYRKEKKEEQMLAATNATDLQKAKDLKEPNGLNELDGKGTGIQVASTYLMQISSAGGQY